MDYSRLSYLTKRVEAGTATKAEKDEYMLILFSNRSITHQQYSDYKSGNNAEEILKAGMVIGGIILLGVLISKIFD